VNILVSSAISVSGRPAGSLSPALEGYTPPEDAAAVRLLKAAGAALAGTPKSAELAFGLAGDTAARTLKETAASAAIGLDTLGEIRLAAASAGLVGYKPSWGIFSRSGVIGFVPSMECVSVLAENVSTVREIAALLAVPDPNDFSMLRKGLPDFAGSVPSVRPPILGLVRECLSDLPPGAVGLLKERGGEVKEISLPDYDLFPLVHKIVGAVEASSAAGNYDGVRFGRRAKNGENWNEMYLATRGKNFSAVIKSYLFQGAYFQFQDYGAFENAARIRRRLVEETEKLFEEIDFLLLPALTPGRDPARAGTVEEIYRSFAHTLPANVLGVPAVTLPEFALQFLAPRLSDPGLLHFAARLNEPGDTP
jgi:aspartyl-tRNA(Asn)/glutamyl-tRNA(Gln) amidotransferase subunit A